MAVVLRKRGNAETRYVRFSGFIAYVTVRLSRCPLSVLRFDGSKTERVFRLLSVSR